MEIDLDVHGDRRGKLIAPEIKRVYYLFDTSPEEIRGCHAHKNLEQLIIAMDGACEFVLDDGKKRETVWLNRPDKALYLGKNMWGEMRNFSYGCKLVVLASNYYNEEEYIRDYNRFLREVNDGQICF